MPRSTRPAVLLLSLLLLTPAALGRPAYKKALAEHYGTSLPARLHTCDVCHLPAPPGAEDTDRPHNPFGARLKAVLAERKKAGQKPDLPIALDLVAGEDADRDGASNLLELLGGRFPGNAGDKPTTAELASARNALTRWQAARRGGYAWQPFDPVRRPPMPVSARQGSGNPIDAFLATAHKKQGLTPRPEAPKHVLLRRIYLDLIGLPPTREELHDFLADSSPDAYEKVVERLLSSPRHGERWARHWMDVWRYADWAGYGPEVRDSQRHIWHWRDWIVEALNADKGYDRMVTEMLAADEAAPEDPDALRATGFLVRNWYMFNRNVWLERTVEHTGKAFLGVTLNCARCHDHFFDPISQKEYYAFRAIFEPHQVRTDRLPGVADLQKDGLPRVFDGQLTAPTYLFIRGNEASPDRSTAIPPAVPAILGGAMKIEPVKLPLAAHKPERREFVIAESLAAGREAIEKARQDQESARRAAQAAVPALLMSSPLTMLARSAPVLRALEQDRLAELSLQAAQARQAALEAVLEVEKLEDEGKINTPPWKEIALRTTTLQREAALREARHARGSAELEAWVMSGRTKPAAVQKVNAARTRLSQAETASKQPASTTYTKRTQASYPDTSTGRRLALARWITARDNPLASRVAVNHVWRWHFGKSLVSTEFDFGRNGQAPSHPELLDWLAVELMDNGWSLKHLHKLILTSTGYRQDSSPEPANLARDPNNRFLWRYAPRRVEGEVIRDSLLALAGLLDGTMGGPEIDHKNGLVSPRRSLYFQHAAEKQVEFLALFDAPSVNECYARTESIAPQQALALANSTLALNASRLLARNLSREVGASSSGHPAFIQSAFRVILGRSAREDEVRACEEFLSEQTILLADRQKLTPAGGPGGSIPPAAEAPLRAREGLVQVLLNHHEFVTIR